MPTLKTTDQILSELRAQRIKNRYRLDKAVPSPDAVEMAMTELTHAYLKHGDDQWGRHEFYAILKEEVDELWDHIKKDGNMIDLKVEILQIICVCFRYLETGDRYREPRMNPE